jgi:N6-adenosine-specific RNA methylase IME4
MMAWIFDPLMPLAYDFIMADPPWSFQHRSAKGETAKSAAGQYDTMTLRDIASMPVSQLARPDAVLWLWATHPMIDQQIEVLRGWGFRFATSGVWIKRTRGGELAFGTGYRLRCASEPFLIGILGNPKTSRSIRSAIEGPIREHSRKPDEAYVAAEAMMPNARRADVFSRQRRLGWEGWGNEADKFGDAA